MNVRTFHQGRRIGTGAALLFWTLAALAETGMVTGNRVNLRAGPGERFEVVVQADHGERLTVLGREEQWLKVRPPLDTDLWVYAALVKDGKVVASKVQVRSGPGINYTAVGQVDRDDMLVVRGEFQEWLKIQPPEDAALWVAAEYVEASAGSADPKPRRPPPAVATDHRREETESVSAPPAAASTSVSVDTTSPAVQKPETAREAASEPPVAPQAVFSEKPSTPTHRKAIATMNVVDEEEIATDDAAGGTGASRVRYRGELRPAGFVLGRAGRFRLVKQLPSGRGVTVCYVRGGEEKLKSLVGRTVVLEGQERMVQGARWPVVDAERIQVLP